MRKAFTLSLDDHFVRRVDAARGHAPRSRWIEDMVEAGALELSGGLPDVPTSDGAARLAAEDRSTNPPISEAVRAGTGGAFARSTAPASDEVQVDVSPEMHVPVDPPGPSTYVRINEADADRIPMRRHAPTCSCAVCKPVKA